MGSSGLLEFRLLGAVEVRRDSEVIQIRGARQRLLLAALALAAGRPVTTARLIEVVWGDAPPASEAHSLEAQVSRLRRALADAGVADAIVTRPGGYLLDVDAERVDAARFEALSATARRDLAEGRAEEAARSLDEALALWRGPALADLRDEPTILAAAQRLDDHRALALESRIDAALALGRHRDVIPELASLIDMYPYRERFRLQLMLALYRSNRQADALDMYRRTRLVLAEELGIEPSPELQALEQAILRQDPGLAPAAVSPRELADGVAVSAEGARRTRWVVLAVALAVIIAVAVVVPLTVQPARVEVPAAGLGALSEDGRSVVAAIELPAPPDDVFAAGGDVWVSSAEARAIYRVDPETEAVVDTIPVGTGASGIAAGGGAIWVANTLDGTVSRIDSSTARVVQTITVGRQPVGLAIGEGSLWVANTADSSISRIDPVSGNVEATIALEAPPFGIAVGARGVWVTSPTRNVVIEIDPGSGDITREIAVGGGPGDAVVAFGAVWVANSRDSTVSRIDPASGTVDATIAVGEGPSGIAAGIGAIWTASAGVGAVTRLDARDVSVTTLEIGNRPADVAVVADRIWFGVRPAVSSIHLGGTLRVVTTYPVPTTDPALAYPNAPNQLFASVYDTLVSLQRVGGADGLQLVPDLAVAVPTPSDEGRTYTFVLRPGLAYSNGSRVEPSDFRHGLERLMTLNGFAAQAFSGLVRADACSVGRPCDLSGAITTNDAARTISFHLREPDPAFLYKLTSYIAAPVPSDVPDRDIGTGSIPGTGPYRVARNIPGEELLLERNPSFRRWSVAATPDGYVDAIHWTFDVPADEAVAAVRDGAADYVMDLPPAAIPELALTLPERLHVNGLLSTEWVFLNRRVSPFDDDRVRRAVALAVDRRAIVDAVGGDEGARVTCQLLPPNMPGYEPYCPHTLDPAPDGVWSGPALALARSLVARSGTTGSRVEILVHAGGIEPIVGARLVATLEALGFRAELSTVTDAEYASAVHSGAAQAGLVTWFADYPLATNFMDIIGCPAGPPEDPAAACDRGLAALVRKANALSVSHAERANELWAEVDRRLTDDAAIVPLINFKGADFTGARVGNYQFNPVSGILLDQLWVQG